MMGLFSVAISLLRRLCRSYFGFGVIGVIGVIGIFGVFGGDVSILLIAGFLCEVYRGGLGLNLLAVVLKALG